MDISRRILSDITVYMKYARYNDFLGRRETWDEIVERNKDMHIKRFPQLKDEINYYYGFVRDRKILPSMRSIQFAGKPIEVSPNRIYNCSYLPVDDVNAFSEVMFLLLGGTGVGYSVQKHHVNKLPSLRGPIRSNGDKKPRRYLIGDSIEGWADAIKVLMESYFNGKQEVEFDFRDIRPKGAKLVTSGGKAPGPQPLKDCIHNIKKVLDNAIVDRGINTKLKPIEVHDIMCYIADAVLAGGIRRAAMISLFSFDDEEMRTCKYGGWWELNPQRGRANNSAVALRYKIQEEDFFDLWEKIRASGSGEPGIFFTNDKDWGINPCAEVSLRPFQFCNLVTIKMSDVVDQQDFNERAKAASFIATLQASYTNFHYIREVWRETTEKEALIGVSMTGLASSSSMNLDFKEAANIVKKENARVSKLININKAARTTTVKPEGCLVGDSLVSTKNGFFTLNEIGNVNGDTWQDLNIDVLSSKGFVKSSKFYVNGKKKTKIIRTLSEIELESTENHKFVVVKDDGSASWVEARYLKVGDRLRFSVGGYDGGELQLLNRTSTNKINEPDYLTSDVAFICGLFDRGTTIKTKDINFVERCKNAFKNVFGVDVKINSYDDVFIIDLLNKDVIDFLNINNLLNDNEIPLKIRLSKSDVILEYLNGLNLDKALNSSSLKSIENIFSKKKAQQIAIILRALGYIAFVFDRDNIYYVLITKYIEKNILDDKKKNLIFSDQIISISDGEDYTYDLSIDTEDHEYIANSYVSHNTSSLVLGTSSGIHPWHSQYYIRRIRVGKNESIYKYLKDNHPELLEDDYFRPDTQAIIVVPQKAPDDAILRDEGALSLLSRVEKIQKEWILTGHRSGSNKNNVSVTVSIKDDEWDSVGRWMWENRDIYTGISVLPYDGGTYIQPPFEDITKDEYEKRFSSLIDVDLTKVNEVETTTNLSHEIACGGSSCEIR